MIPNGTRFIGIAPEVDLTERGSALLNKRTEPYTIDDIRGYKVFTALLTQSGGDNPYELPGDLSQISPGWTYTIVSVGYGEDWTLWGAPNNNTGTSFVATGTENVITSQLTTNTGAPVATVLENTIGNVWFTYDGVGNYSINSNGLFIAGKSTIMLGNVTWDGGSGIIKSGFDGGVGLINTSDYSNEPVDNYAILNTPIEIRVYN